MSINIKIADCEVWVLATNIIVKYHNNTPQILRIAIEQFCVKTGQIWEENIFCPKSFTISCIGVSQSALQEALVDYLQENQITTYRRQDDLDNEDDDLDNEDEELNSYLKQLHEDIDTLLR